MAKTKISEFSATPANNTDIDGINIAEGCAPSGINDAIRELMSQLKDFQAGTAGDSFNGPVGTTTAAAGAFTTLTTSSTVTHNGGTANGVAYLNGSKVLTTGSALTFDGAGVLTVGSDSVATVFNAPGDVVQYVVDSNGTGSSASHQWRYGSTEAMRLTSTGLGIGTSSPSAPLTVKTSAATSNAINLIGRTSGNASAISFYASDATTRYAFLYADTTTLQIGTGNTAQAYLDSSGNLGLGVTPSAWYVYKAMQVGQSGAVWSNPAANELYLSSNYYYSSAGDKYIANGYASFYRQLNGAHTWATAPSGTAGNAISFTQAMTLDASGNLGIGTSSPDTGVHLRVYGNSYYTAQYGTGNKGRFGADATGAFIDAVGATPLVFQTNTTERARITSSGNFGIGTNNPSAALEAVGSATKEAAKFFGDNDVVKVFTAHTLSGQGSKGAILFYHQNNITGAIVANNNGTTSYNTSSDYRLKHDIAPMTGALAKVAALKPVTYKWNADGSDGEGFIAHELAEVVPQCVTGEKDAVDAEGKPVYQGIDTSFLVATLTAAIQELKAELDSVKSELTSLKG